MSLHLSDFIKPERIRPRTVRAYLKEKELRLSADFDRLKSTCYRPDEDNSYHVHTKEFLVKADLATVWDTYLTIPPRETWRSRMVSFGCLYCRKKRALTYLKDAYDGLREGQVVFLNISLGWGLINIAVAHKIVRVDTRHKNIEFSYIEGGKTEGSQRLLFKKTAEGHTRIIHRTTYRGSTRSYLRDKKLYPYLHGQVIASFHRNVRDKVMESTLQMA